MKNLQLNNNMDVNDYIINIIAEYIQGIYSVNDKIEDIEADIFDFIVKYPVMSWVFKTVNFDLEKIKINGVNMLEVILTFDIDGYVYKSSKRIELKA